MDEITMSFTIQTDSEGYITLECPYCDSEFMLNADELQNEEEPFSDIYCPYCGLSKDKTFFYSKEVLEKARALATNYMISELNEAFGGMQRSINRSNGLLKMTYKPMEKVTVKELREKDTSGAEFECKVCHHHVKALYCAGVSKIFCPYCGVDL